MASSYRDALEHIRRAFPQPVSDPIHDSYFVHSIMRALDQVDDLKMQLPTLGPVVSGDFAEAQNAELPAEMSSVEAVTSDLVSYLRGITISSHPHTQQNVIAPPTIPSLIGVLLASLHNPNIAWDEYSRLVALAEVEAVAITARMVGYDPQQAGGTFTFGGTGTTLYGVKIGLEKACPQAMDLGVPEDVVVLVSDAGHYCAHNIVGWLGIGTDQLIVIPTIAENEIDLAQLEDAARAALDSGKKIAAIIATMGTTDAFGLDDLQAIVAMRDSLVEEFQLSYRPHIHADSVIGWAWSVFNDYDFQDNPLEFRPRTLRALAGACRRIRHLALADSMGIDFHKTGFAPYISSLVLVKDRTDLQLLMRRPATDAVPLSLWRPPPRHVHARNIQSRDRPANCAGQFSLFRRAGVARRTRAHRRDDPTFARAPRRTRSHHRAQPRQLWHGNALPGVSTRRGYFCDQAPRIRRPCLSGNAASPQRLQPQNFRLRARGGHGRTRGRHFLDRLLPAHPIPGTDCRAEVLYRVAVCG